jgi:hypothetical protein
LRLDRGHEQPTGRPALWLHKAREIHPLGAWSHHDPHATPFSGPGAAQDGLETDAVLILTPQFDPRSMARGLSEVTGAFQQPSGYSLQCIK